ncbi:MULTISPECIES: hypothetical protein [Flavobacteriaceae]|uniref:hypothetical protein n=1 Tax=Flavobacteriaceae TaxID=49546 RepID=UPI003A942BBA
MNKEKKAIFYLIVVVIISIILFVAFSLGYSFLEKNTTFWTYFLIYFLTVITFNLLTIKIKFKMVKKAVYIYSLPLSILFFLFQFTVPTITVLIQVVYFIIFSTAFPYLILKVNDYFRIIGLNSETETFLQMTVSIIIAVSFNQFILEITYRLSPFTLKPSKKIEKLKLVELVDYIINLQNIRFVIYTSFFIYLIIFSFQQLENSTIFITSQHDRAILQSFLCFLAYDRIILNSKNIALLPSLLLNKFLTSINSGFIIDEKKESEK